ncbi:oxygenase MpaB family protein [Acinetobacter populi]|uniref:ER-bound oxygenase mpaB/mpaB'/Rubber oxygenase catalytic domain-containing protein n=1 Tax=Acinetobacter populi TaxID=1582270 RepID=A0A1Z9Z006_9GAMM|nr:oxygenase MpaB family protein [Acinetobacter populi]OUY07767.1 hypothetical protein CAP51_08555 [Acinetobacter populi]
MYTSSPSRLVPFEATQKSDWIAQVLNKLCDQPVQPTAQDYSALQQALSKGDGPMEAVIEWVMQNPKQHRQYFETALFKGLDALPENIPELDSFFRHVETKPSWVDDDKINRAIDFTYRLGINNGLVLRDVSLMAGYMFPGFNQPLILTGALKQQVGTRLAETTKWWIDITERNGLERYNHGFSSTIYVRFIHALVRHQLKKSERWDADTWGVPINQFDLAMTNIAFSSVVLLGIRGLGIFPNKAEVDDYLHFWRYVGWLMGVEEQWQVKKESEGWRFMYWLQFSHPKSDASSAALGASLSKEPFEREYRYLRSLQQKLAYRQHLEITQFFIGKKRMQSLGLPNRPAAWFAYYLIARNVVLYTGAKRIPKLKHFLENNGRQMQKMGLALYKNQSKKLASMHK